MDTPTCDPLRSDDYHAVAQHLVLSRYERENGYSCDEIIDVRVDDHERMVAAALITSSRGTVYGRLLIATRSADGCWRAQARLRGRLMMGDVAELAVAVLDAARQARRQRRTDERSTYEPMPERADRGGRSDA